jgi:hypothetical protein
MPRLTDTPDMYRCERCETPLGEGESCDDCTPATFSADMLSSVLSAAAPERMVYIRLGGKLYHIEVVQDRILDRVELQAGEEYRPE